jgi:hypothetical protein
MARKKDTKPGLKSAIQNLITQEVRFLQLERNLTPSFVSESVSSSVEEAKKEVMRTVRGMDQEERAELTKKIVREVIDEEIEQAIQLRKTRCFRCVNIRFFDEKGAPHLNLPIGTRRAEVIGCEETDREDRERCQHFVETSMAISLEDYLDDVTILYELREMFDRFDEMWEEYLTR